VDQGKGRKIQPFYSKKQEKMEEIEDRRYMGGGKKLTKLKHHENMLPKYLLFHSFNNKFYSTWSSSPFSWAFS
jgi:hypothetical protein